MLLVFLLIDAVPPLVKGIVLGVTCVVTALLFSGVLGASAYQRITGLTAPRTGFGPRRAVIGPAVVSLVLGAALELWRVSEDLLGEFQPGFVMAGIFAISWVLFLSLHLRHRFVARPPKDL